MHPYFNSAIPWHTRLADAQAEAVTKSRLVFVVHGRERCAGTRTLVERALAKEEIEELVAERFVALASDPDHCEPEVAALVAALPRTEPTPVCVYLSPSDLAVRHATAGGRPPAVLVNDMLQACARR